MFPAALLPIVGWSALGTGLTTAGYRLAKDIPVINEVFGLTPEQIAKGEEVNLLRPDEIVDYDPGDKLRLGLLGYSEKDIANKRAEQLRSTIQDDRIAERDAIRELKTGLGLKYNEDDYLMQPGKNENQYTSRLQTEASKLEYIDQLRSLNPDANITELLGKSPLQLQDEVNRTQEAITERAALLMQDYGKEELAKLTDEFDPDQVRAARVAANKKSKLDLSNPLSDASVLNREQQQYLTSQRKSDRVFNRQGQELNRANQLAMMTLQNQIANQQQNFDLTRMEMDYRNRRDDRMDERNRRKEEQAMIMMLIRGLTQGVGSAFN